MTNDEFAAEAARSRHSWAGRLEQSQRQRAAIKRAIDGMPVDQQRDAEAVHAHLVRLGAEALGLDRVPLLEAVKGAIRDRHG